MLDGRVGRKPGVISRTLTQDLEEMEIEFHWPHCISQFISLHDIRVLSTCLIVLQHAFIENIGRSSYNTPMLVKVRLISWISLEIILISFITKLIIKRI